MISRSHQLVAVKKPGVLTRTSLNIAAYLTKPHLYALVPPPIRNVLEVDPQTQSRGLVRAAVFSRILRSQQHDAVHLLSHI